MTPRRHFLSMLGAALLACGLLSLPGCVTWGKKPAPGQPGPTPPTPAETKRIVAGHHTREAVQFKAAERINVVVTGTEVEVPVKEQTAIIVQANKDASAQQIDDMAAAFLRATAALEARHGEDQRTIASLREENARLKDAAAQETVSTLRKIGLGCLGLALVVGYIGFSALPLRPLRPWAFVLASLGVLALAFAQLWAYLTAQAWFMPLTGAVAVAILGAIGYAGYRSFRDGTLAKDAAEAAEQTGDTLKVLVGAIEHTKKQLGKAAPISALLDIIEKRTDSDHRAVIEDAVRETKPV